MGLTAVRVIGIVSFVRLFIPASLAVLGLTTSALAGVSIQGSGYAGLNFSQSGGFVPPATCGAAGSASYVETVNQEIAIYSPKATGASRVSDSLTDFRFGS
jgi:hypothetical protein